MNGIVFTLNLQPGNYVSLSQSIATITSSPHKLIARLVIPPKGIGQINLASKVSLQLKAFPYKQYGCLFGVITQIDSSYVNPKDQVGPIKLSDPAYYATITLDSNVAKHFKGNLYPGMTFSILHMDRKCHSRI